MSPPAEDSGEFYPGEPVAPPAGKTVVQTKKDQEFEIPHEVWEAYGPDVARAAKEADSSGRGALGIRELAMFLEKYTEVTREEAELEKQEKCMSAVILGDSNNSFG